MPAEANANDPALVRRYGSLVSVAAVAIGLLYLIALLRRSYWAVAAPMTVLVLGSVAGAVALGRVLMTTPDEEPDPE